MGEYWLQIAAIVEIASVGCTVLLGCAVFWLRHSFVKHKVFADQGIAMSASIEALRLRVSDCERRHEGTAKVADITAVTVRLTEIDGSVRTVTATVDGMEKAMDKIGNAVDRIEQYLIGNKI